MIAEEFMNGLFNVPLGDNVVQDGVKNFSMTLKPRLQRKWFC